MPVKRRASKHQQHRLTDAAIAAYAAGDRSALFFALRWKPWLPSPLDVPADGEPPEYENHPAGYRLAQELTRALEAACAERGLAIADPAEGDA